MQITSYPRGPMVRREAPKEVPAWTLVPKAEKDAPAIEGEHFRAPLPRTEAEKLASDRAHNRAKASPHYHALALAFALEAQNGRSA